MFLVTSLVYTDLVCLVGHRFTGDYCFHDKCQNGVEFRKRHRAYTANFILDLSKTKIYKEVFVTLMLQLFKNINVFKTVPDRNC